LDSGISVDSDDFRVGCFVRRREQVGYECIRWGSVKTGTHPWAGTEHTGMERISSGERGGFFFFSFVIFFFSVYFFCSIFGRVGAIFSLGCLR
jgi:hypothetical protein